MQSHHSTFFHFISGSSATTTPTTAASAPTTGTDRCSSADLPDANSQKKPLHPKLVGIVASLEMKPLWDEFNELGTEMIGK